MGTFGITSSDLDKLAKKKGLKNRRSITRMSSKELNELLSKKGADGSHSPKGSDKPILSFSFSYHVEELGEGYKITLTGRHYSKNSVNKFGRRERIRYSKAISQAAEDFRLVNMRFFRSLVAFEKAEVHYVFHNPRSRDHDNNSETIKHFQDTLTTLGFIVDDNRKCLSHPKDVGETLGREYKAEAFLLPVN